MKNDLQLVGRDYINGKYLYNKYRELALGKPLIKISGEYKFILFKYIGYKDIFEFLKGSSLTKKESKLQRSLLSQKSTNRDYYYVCYYFGEDKKMNKGTTTFFNNWKTVEMKYVYTEVNGDSAEYNFHANVIHSEPFIFLDTKYYLRNKKSEGARCVFFIGKSSPSERFFLKGTYSGYDKYDRAIAGLMILQRFDTPEEVEEELKDNTFNPIISQELKNKRMVIESEIIKDLLKLSKTGPFAKLLSKFSGAFNLKFHTDKKINALKINILKNHYKITSPNDTIIIEKDSIQVICKGRILKLDFSINGVFFLQIVSIYINILDFSETNIKTHGTYNGIDVNNNIVSGRIDLEYRNT